MEQIADRIRAARTLKGMSQQRLAVILGVHRATVAHWERDSGFTPTLDNLRELSRALDVRIDWLICGDVEQPTSSSDDISDQAHATPRSHLESRLLQLSKHLPMSFLGSIISMMESVAGYLG
ncbi:PbsX family transcriptional regulator [Xanthomonas bromi]|uniref:Transcriptional regulator n=1 Tax=Xanthomonas bromi TaxID=56449 RepID=A0A1C3NR65_9XANT|nr:helix-turn-helix domain-containing protein [Xanthomonas bromi]PPV05203.1 transcriptional regulator [Xanthomonas bromi]SBV52871.1 PbsX family transcriptional regulator [Xanthomonas bromi]